MSSEITLAEDTSDCNLLGKHLLAQAQSVARQLRRHRVVARTVTLKLKTGDFQRLSRSQTLTKPIRSSDAIYHVALALLKAYPMPKPVRLVGVAVSGLQSEKQPVQQGLFVEVEETLHRKWESVDQAMDAVTQKYGHSFVARGIQTSSQKNKK